MATNPMYDTVIRKLQQLRPTERITRVRNLAWLMIGIFKSKSVHLSKIAMHIPGSAVQLSIVQRLHRFLENPWFQVRAWYEPVAEQLVQAMGQGVGEIRLIMDTTKCGAAHQWLTVSLAFRRRTVPLAWTWLRGARGHSSAQVQLALLNYVHRLIPLEIPVVLVADTEFEDGDVQKQLQAWAWGYVLRQKSNNSVKVTQQWASLGTLTDK